MRVFVRATALALLLFLIVGCNDGRHRGGGDWSAAPIAPSSGTVAPTITVTGVGIASGEPNSVTLSLGVEASASTTVEVLRTVSTDATKLTDYLLGAGVAAKDLQTTNLSVYPTYDYTDSGKQGVITGYQASLTVSAVVDGVDHAATIIDGAATAVGDSLRIYGLSMSIADRTALLAEARTNAVDQARTQAQQLADAAGVSLGQVVSITEGSSDSTYPTYPGASEGDRSLNPGTQVLQVSVTMVFEVVV